MFGTEEDNKNNQGLSYGRNQQYGRGNNTGNALSSNANKGVLKFEDTDSDEEQDGVITGTSGAFYKNPEKVALYDNSSFAVNNISGQDRPLTGQGKTNALDKQRELMINKQKAGFSSNAQTSMKLNSRPGSSYSYGQNTDIDFNKLKTIVKENSSGMYEPGNLNGNGVSLAPISKTNNTLKFDEKNKDNQQSKFINLDDSDDDDEDDKIITKPSQPQSQSQPQSTIPKEDSDAASKKAKAQALIKDLYGDSSEDSEEEDDSLAHQNMLVAEQAKGNDEDDEKDEIKSQQLAPASGPDQLQNPQQLAALNQQLPAVIAGNIEILDIKQFITKPIPKGLIIQTTIKRDKSGFARFYPKYHLHLSNGLRYIMTGKKRSSNKTSNYLMSISKNDLTKKSQSFIGKVRSNFLGTEFLVYDTGCNPKKSKGNISAVRSEIGAVLYESNLLGSKGPRKMKVFIPNYLPNGEPIQYKPMKSSEGIVQMGKQSDKNGLIILHNKPPKWNDGVQAFVLNFNGRVDRPSVKNFQLIDDTDDENIMLQFGRISDDAFNMDVKYPFSLLQAFGIILSSFDYKIACE